MILISNLERLENESINQYKIRLCQIKEEADLTWSELASLVNKEAGTNLSGDTYRKEWTSYQKGFNDGITQQVSDEEILKQLDLKKLELQQLKFKISDQRTELNKVLRQQSRFDDLKDLLRVEIAKLSKVKPLIDTTHTTPTDSVRSAILPLSDWHRGIGIKNQINYLDDKEFRARVERLLQETIIRCKENGVTKLHAPLVGDEIAGLIHDSIRVSSYEKPITQIKNVCEILANFFYELSRHFDIDIYSVFDNHSRLFQEKGTSTQEDSFASLIPWFLQARLNHIHNIKFVGECDDSVMFNVVGNNILVMHGHLDKPESATDLALTLGINPDVIILGHWHNSINFESYGVQIVVCPSLIGTDEYAMGLRKYSVPAQKLLIFEQGKQGILCEYNIRVADKRKLT